MLTSDVRDWKKIKSSKRKREFDNTVGGCGIVGVLSVVVSCKQENKEKSMTRMPRARGFPPDSTAIARFIFWMPVCMVQLNMDARSINQLNRTG